MFVYSMTRYHWYMGAESRPQNVLLPQVIKDSELSISLNILTNITFSFTKLTYSLISYYDDRISGIFI
jgi:hypothetical protein